MRASTAKRVVICLLSTSAWSAEVDARAAGEETLYAAPGAPLELATEGGGAVEAAVDGGALVALPAPAPARLTAPVEEGGHWLTLVSRDAVGRTSEVRWLRLVVDGAPPEIELTTEPPAAAVDGVLWTSAAARVVVRASDAVSGVAHVGVACGGEPVVAVGGAAACTLAGGAAATTASIAAWAEDAAGNRAETTAGWRLDAVPPRVALVIEGDSVDGAAGPVMAPSARLTTPAEDAGSGVGGFELRLDGEAVDGFDGLTTGVHRAEAMALDRAGNRSPAAALDFAYDDRPPAVEAELLPGGEAGGVLLRLTVHDEPAGLASVTWSAPGVPWRSLASTAAAAGTPPAELSFDAAGARTAVSTEVRLPLAAGTRGTLTLAALDRVGNQARLELPLPEPGEEGR